MIEIAGRRIGPGEPCWIIAELGANCPTLAIAQATIRAAKAAGADAIKTQAYTQASMTLDCDMEPFHIKVGPWAGQTLWRLYGQAAMPRDWHRILKQQAEALGMTYFSTAFCCEDVDFLEELGVPCHKIASFELTDLPLIEYAANKRKPLILSTGMATQREIWAAWRAAWDAGARDIVLLRCVSGYPAPLSEMRLATIRHLATAWRATVGLSDHSLGHEAAMLAVALGACVVEKHLILDRTLGTPDAAFSLEPGAFEAMVGAVRSAESAIGQVGYGPVASEATQFPFRRSLFVVADMVAGGEFTRDNVCSIRPAAGLPVSEVGRILGRRAARDIERGTPLAWELVT